MSLLGKLLIVLNLLAAGAFAYLTLENWKVRHNLTTAALTRNVALNGLPVEAPSTPGSVGSDQVPFHMEADGTIIESVAKKDFIKVVPPGDDFYGAKGGDTIADQTAEVKRLQKKLFEPIPALENDPNPRFNALRGYLLNLARTGAERDGVNALFDQHVEDRRYMARRDLPLLGRTPSQSAALRALVAVAELGDPQSITPQAAQAARILTTREAVRQFLLGEVPHGVAGAGDRTEAERKLTNAILGAFDRKGGAEDVAAAATADQEGWKQLAIVAAEPLTDKPSCTKTITALLAYATGKQITPTEGAALTGIATLIEPPPVNFNRDATIDTVATNLLNQKFDEAALPAIGKGQPSSSGEKARKIAHLLYHIDAHRHGLRDEATVAARKAWHERVAAVVGLPEYVRAAEAQASEYAEAASRLVAAITEEQSAFEADYQAQVQRVHFLFTQWLTQSAAFNVQEAITKENDKLKAERETERNNLQKELTKSVEEAKLALTKLTSTQKQLFDIQKQLRDAQAALLTLEQELRRLESGDKLGRLSD
jgi:hypothetical protein